jgi:hypothetical protein
MGETLQELVQTSYGSAQSRRFSILPLHVLPTIDVLNVGTLEPLAGEI